MNADPINIMKNEKVINASASEMTPSLHISKQMYNQTYANIDEDAVTANTPKSLILFNCACRYARNSYCGNNHQVESSRTNYSGWSKFSRFFS